MANTEVFGRLHELPEACTPIVMGALAQVLPSQTTCSLLVGSSASLSASLHGPPRTGAAAGDGVVEALITWAGSATGTDDGATPTRVATTGTRTTAPCAPHSLDRAVCVTVPRSVPSACGANDPATLSCWVAMTCPFG